MFKHFSEDYVFTRFQETIDKLMQRNIISDLTHIQIDCDWTLSTKDRYFQFLNKLKSSLKLLALL